MEVTVDHTQQYNQGVGNWNKWYIVVMVRVIISFRHLPKSFFYWQQLMWDSWFFVRLHNVVLIRFIVLLLWLVFLSISIMLIFTLVSKIVDTYFSTYFYSLFYTNLHIVLSASTIKFLCSFNGTTWEQYFFLYPYYQNEPWVYTTRSCYHPLNDDDHIYLGFTIIFLFKVVLNNHNSLLLY